MVAGAQQSSWRAALTCYRCAIDASAAAPRAPPAFAQRRDRGRHNATPDTGDPTAAVGTQAEAGPVAGSRSSCAPGRRKRAPPVVEAAGAALATGDRVGGERERRWLDGDNVAIAVPERDAVGAGYGRWGRRRPRRWGSARLTAAMSCGEGDVARDGASGERERPRRPQWCRRRDGLRRLETAGSGPASGSPSSPAAPAKEALPFLPTSMLSRPFTGDRR